MSRPLRLLLALGVAVAAAVPTLVVAGAGPAHAAGSVTPSKSTEIDPAGETLTVTGSGFDSSRGVYVWFCEQVGTSGTPAGRPTGANCFGDGIWVSNTPGAMDGKAAWSGAGTFSVSIPVVGSFGSVDCRAAGTVCGIVTRNDHLDAGSYDQDTFTPLAFAADEGEGPQIVVDPATGLDAAGDVVQVDGTGIPAGQGVYVRLCQAPMGTVGTAAGRPVPAVCDGDGLWATPSPPAGQPLPPVVDGAFSVELDVVGAFAGETSVIDCTAPSSCGVFVRRDHNGGAADFSLDSFTPITFDPATEPPVVTPPTEPSRNDVVVTLSESEDLADGQTITVTGRAFTPDQGVYVQFCARPPGQVGTSAGRASSCYPEQDGTHTVWVTPIAANGQFSTPLTVVSSFTDASGQAVDCTVATCGVFVRRDHSGGTSDFSQDAFVPVSFGDGTVAPAPSPTLGADRTTDLDPAGDAIVVTGAGFRPGDALFVAVCDANVANFAACDYEHVAEVTPALADGAAARAAGEPGSFAIDLAVRARFDGTDCQAEGTACAVQTWAVSGGDGAAEVSVPIAFAASAAVAAPTPLVSEPPSAAPAAVGTGSLPRTGAPVGPTALAGALAIVAGAMVLVAARRLDPARAAERRAG